MDAQPGHQQPGRIRSWSGSTRRTARATPPVWAADLAAAWGAPLHLVHVVPERPTLTEVPPWLGELQDAARRAGAASPRADILWGVPADLLAGRAVGARMLVLGSYGEGAGSGMLAGSLALALLDRVTCPVAVVRGSTPQVPPPGSGPVVVGVDGSPAGRAALTFAADLAGSWAAPLVAVHTWADVVAGIHGGVRRTEAPATLAAEAGAVLEAELDAVAASHPDCRCSGRWSAARPFGPCSPEPMARGCSSSGIGATPFRACCTAPPAGPSWSSRRVRSW